MSETYLYTWNPKKWYWRGLRSAAAKVAGGVPRKDFWSCGTTKRIVRGDRFLLIRLGAAPKGIMGAGEITSAPRNVDHWDDGKRAVGRVALGTDVLFRRLSVEPLLSLEILGREFPSVHWTPQNGGSIVPEAVADQIFKRIYGKSDSREKSVETFEEQVWRLRAAGGLSKPKGVSVPDKEVVTVERSFRDASVALWAQKQAKGRCELCRSDAPFEDARGYPFLEVHHIVPLAEGGPDVPSNVVALCPNCHRRCHHGRDSQAVGRRVARIVRRRRD